MVLKMSVFIFIYVGLDSLTKSIVQEAGSVGKIAHIVDKTNYLIAKCGYEKSKQINYFLKFYK